MSTVRKYFMVDREVFTPDEDERDITQCCASSETRNSVARHESMFS